MNPELREQFLDAIENHWGDGTLMQVFAPSQIGNQAFEEWWGRMQRSAVSPGMARQLMDMLADTDLRAILPTIRVPTLVMHSTGDRSVSIEHGREVAQRKIFVSKTEMYRLNDVLGTIHKEFTKLGETRKDLKETLSKLQEALGKAGLGQLEEKDQTKSLADELGPRGN